MLKKFLGRYKKVLANGVHAHYNKAMKSQATLTTQEQTFLDRIATYLVGTEVTETTLIEAAKQVLADDRRLVSKVCGNDEFKHAACSHLSPIVYRAIRV